MIEIKLNDNENGYDVIEEYVRRYWKHNADETVVVCMETSYDGKKYYNANNVVEPGFDCYDTTTNYDWWEGEKYIKLHGIIGINKITTIDGTGLYEE